MFLRRMKPLYYVIYQILLNTYISTIWKSISAYIGTCDSRSHISYLANSILFCYTRHINYASVQLSLRLLTYKARRDLDIPILHILQGRCIYTRSKTLGRWLH